MSILNMATILSVVLNVAHLNDSWISFLHYEPGSAQLQAPN